MLTTNALKAFVYYCIRMAHIAKALANDDPSPIQIIAKRC